jgi:DNA-binding CsgD family transcriptional regulator
MEQGLTVNVVCEFEPLREGLARMIEDAASTRLGVAVDRVSSLGAASGDSQAVLLIETGQIRELTLFEAESPGRTLERVVFVGPLPAGGEAAATIAAAAALRSGVAFLAESGRAERIVEAIGLVWSGAFVCEMEFARQLRARDTEGELRERLAHARLSPREQDVLLFVASGLANKEIALQLHLAEGTVKAHVSHILTKLSASTRVDLVRYALLLSNDIDHPAHSA